MRLVFQAVLRSLPQILRLVVAISFFFTWISIVMVKVYKDDEYHCDNAYAVAETKEECLEWGGDWVKRTLNFQSLISTLVIGTAICVMEGWSYHMAETMDLRGKGNAPSYNSNEHIQIFYLSVFFGGMILVNFFVSIMMLSYTRAKQALSGEKGLTAIQRKWLNVKTYILSLEPPKQKRLPVNCFRRFLFRVCLHQAYQAFQGLTLLSFLVLSALYSINLDADTKAVYWQIVGLYIGLSLLDYLMKLVVFGYKPNRRIQLALDTLICLYLIAGYSLRQSSDDRSSQSRMVSGLIVFLLPIRSFQRKFLLI